ncbi:nuclear transport factor 2 family protein [Aquimarina mytili]|uniref:Nuclear transport factor 2 family protein n=1 Tax=Aquimarina mytili TaxID=874423 RepID=A0A936ZYN4_9FLAO|nr:nuclear transport factor 2 family protein [Aquimarina mytili]MBL0684756.1 nuclear transport factor 2 family protein [Aquimarina mytili]
MNNYQEIMNLESRAEMTFDNGLFDEHLSLWDQNECKFESPFGNFEEAKTYIDWLKGFYEMTQKLGGTRHLILNPVVEIKNDIALFTGYLYIINKSNGSFMGTSVMNDRFKKIDSQWAFVYRSVTPDQDLSNLLH